MSEVRSQDAESAGTRRRQVNLPTAYEEKPMSRMFPSTTNMQGVLPGHKGTIRRRSSPTGCGYTERPLRVSVKRRIAASDPIAGGCCLRKSCGDGGRVAPCPRTKPGSARDGRRSKIGSKHYKR
ncbi:hypothetical protein GN956_G5616 [Arapaima gigas]